MTQTNKSRPSAGNTGTAQTKHNAPIISHDLDECKQYSTLRAQLALAGYTVAHEIVVRRHGQEPVIVASVEALAAFVRGVL